MRILQINTTCGVGSTGKICVGISQLLNKENIENYILYTNKSNGYALGISCANVIYLKTQALRSHVLGNYGFNSRKATRTIIEQLEKIQPDIVHLHNIHSHDCDLEVLFSYFKKKQTKLIWTFHDCWAFTGYCPHFTMAGCDKWKQQCGNCVQKREYAWFFDKSKELYEKKKRLFDGLDLTIVTPSQWLADMVRQSFLKDYTVEIIHNGIDLSIFSPMQSEFRQKNGLMHKKIVLGVAFDWGKRKGLDVFLDLAERLPEEYQIILVGTNKQIDKQLPDRILSIHRTTSQQELAELYSAADVFVNPTREDNYPTVHMEAIACGTPVITFRTGGSPEMLDETCGSVIVCDDVESLEKEIIRICTDMPYSKEACIRKAESFDKNQRFKEYVELYERVNTAGTQGY